MIKRYYQGLVSMKYACFMFGLPLIIFILAYIDVKKHISSIQYIMAGFTLILVIVMCFYFKDRIKVMKALKEIDDIEEYENGGIVDHSKILNDRILCFNRMEIHEVSLNTLKSVEMDTDRPVLHLKDEERCTDMSVRDRGEAEKLCAFIKRKCPNVSFENIEPKGTGTLKELGAW